MASKPDGVGVGCRLQDFQVLGADVINEARFDWISPKIVPKGLHSIRNYDLTHEKNQFMLVKDCVFLAVGHTISSRRNQSHSSTTVLIPKYA
jgi:hypothetical protein